MADELYPFTRYLRCAPRPPSAPKEGRIGDVLGVEASVMLIIDSNGRVHQLMADKIINARLTMLLQPREAIAHILDKWNVLDWKIDR